MKDVLPTPGSLSRTRRTGFNAGKPRNPPKTGRAPAALYVLVTRRKHRRDVHSETVPHPVG